jgi:C4-dicarboxylate-specific signal transduction histidine kinase
LCLNSLEAIGNGGRIEVAASLVAEAAAVVLTVRDNGPGIPPATREHVFDPFYSGREAGRGLGFGLSKAWRIITEHGGRLSAAPSTHRGAEFTVELPLKQPPD